MHRLKLHEKPKHLNTRRNREKQRHHVNQISSLLTTTTAVTTVLLLRNHWWLFTHCVCTVGVRFVTLGLDLDRSSANPLWSTFESITIPSLALLIIQWLVDFQLHIPNSYLLVNHISPNTPNIQSSSPSPLPSPPSTSTSTQSLSNTNQSFNYL